MPISPSLPTTVQIAKSDEPGLLKDRLDLAWQSIRSKLVRGLSIGFAPIEYSHIEETGGYRFIKWAWLELSAVTIPANTEASIATIKSCDRRRIIRTPHSALKHYIAEYVAVANEVMDEQ
jgi:phage head maturation protease